MPFQPIGAIHDLYRDLGLSMTWTAYGRAAEFSFNDVFWKQNLGDVTQMAGVKSDENNHDLTPIR